MPFLPGLGLVADTDTYGTTIGSDTFINNQEGGVDMRDGWGMTVRGNSFARSPGQAVRLGPEAGRTVISGNNFSAFYRGPDGEEPEAPASGILLENTAEITIDGNLLAGMPREAIRCEGTCKHVSVMGNVIGSVSQEAPGRYPPHNLQERTRFQENNVIETLER